MARENRAGREIGNRARRRFCDRAPSCGMYRAAAQAPAQSVRAAIRNQSRMCAWVLIMETAQIVVRKRGVDRIRRGHLWVYRSDVLNPKDAEPGSIATVRDERGVGPVGPAVLGKAF